MQMTAREIVSSFNRAENKKDKVVILAELNACDKETICEVLRRNGVEESLIPDFSKKTIVVENQDKKGGNGMARKTTDQTAKATVTETQELVGGIPAPTQEERGGNNADGSNTPEKKVIPKAVIEVVKTEMQRLCEVILEAEQKRAELVAFITEAE